MPHPGQYQFLLGVPLLSPHLVSPWSPVNTGLRDCVWPGNTARDKQHRRGQSKASLIAKHVAGQEAGLVDRVTSSPSTGPAHPVQDQLTQYRSSSPSTGPAHPVQVQLTHRRSDASGLKHNPSLASANPGPGSSETMEPGAARPERGRVRERRRGGPKGPVWGNCLDMKSFLVSECSGGALAPVRLMLSSLLMSF
ncbi:unnamed protein product [Gadus morhua 'NCC']